LAVVGYTNVHSDILFFYGSNGQDHLTLITFACFVQGHGVLKIGVQDFHPGRALPVGESRREGLDVALEDHLLAELGVEQLVGGVHRGLELDVDLDALGHGGRHVVGGDAEVGCHVFPPDAVQLQQGAVRLLPRHGAVHAYGALVLAHPLDLGHRRAARAACQRDVTALHQPHVATRHVVLDARRHINTQSSDLSLDSLSVDLAHVGARVSRLHAADTEEPRAVAVVRDGDAGVARDHVVAHRQDDGLLLLDPRHLIRAEMVHDAGQTHVPPRRKRHVLDGLEEGGVQALFAGRGLRS